jgi:hypothetical protein
MNPHEEGGGGVTTKTFLSKFFGAIDRTNNVQVSF